jgi:hypothetical protein
VREVDEAAPDQHDGRSVLGDPVEHLTNSNSVENQVVQHAQSVRRQQSGVFIGLDSVGKLGPVGVPFTEPPGEAFDP